MPDSVADVLPPALWASLQQPALGRAIRALRQAAGLSQEALADRIDAAGGHDTGMAGLVVSRWERARTDVSRRYRSTLATVADDLLTAMDTPTRRQVIRRIAGLAGAAGLGILVVDDERLSYALTHPARADDQVLEDLVRLTRLYVDQAQRMAPTVLLPAVVDLMRRIRWMLEAPHPAGIRRQLERLYAETAVIAGRLAFWREDRGLADELLKRGIGLAADLSESQLRALALAFRADLASGIPLLGTVPANTTRALALFDGAAELADPAWPPLLRAWVLACRAEELATLGRADEADREMDAAHTAMDADHPGEGEIIDISTLDISAAAAGLSGFEGAVAIALGRGRQAREAFESGLREQSSIGRLSGLAAALALEGEIDGAAELLEQGLEEAVRRQLPTRLRRVEGVRNAYLSRWQSHPSVQRLDERLKDIA